MRGGGRLATSLTLLALLLIGCGKEENSPDMGAVAPKPNLSASANAPGGVPTGADPSKAKNR